MIQEDKKEISLNVTHTSTPLDDVRAYWNSQPLMSLEISAEPGTRRFFEDHNRIRAEAERFALCLWEFDRHEGEKVLDIGCGPGWLVRHFAQGNANVFGIDLTPKAVSIAQQGLELFRLKGTVVEGNAESLPFPDESFDFVTSAGVLHHTPDTEKAFREVFRVLKPGGRAVISLYYKHYLLHENVFPLLQSLLKILRVVVPGRPRLAAASSPEDFVRIYDGPANPIGKAYNAKECVELAGRLKLRSHEIHYFPERFFPLVSKGPIWLRRLLDKNFGTMIYLSLEKSN